MPSLPSSLPPAEKRSGASAISSESSIQPFSELPRRHRRPCSTRGRSHRLRPQLTPSQPVRAAHRPRCRRERPGAEGPPCSHGSRAGRPAAGRTPQLWAALAPAAAGCSPGLAAGAPTGRRRRTCGAESRPGGTGREGWGGGGEEHRPQLLPRRLPLGPPVPDPSTSPAPPAAVPAPTCSESRWERGLSRGGEKGGGATARPPSPFRPAGGGRRRGRAAQPRPTGRPALLGRGRRSAARKRGERVDGGSTESRPRPAPAARAAREAVPGSSRLCLLPGRCVKTASEHLSTDRGWTPLTH